MQDEVREGVFLQRVREHAGGVLWAQVRALHAREQVREPGLKLHETVERVLEAGLLALKREEDEA